MLKIERINEVFCKISNRTTVAECLSYDAYYYKKGKYKKEKKVYRKDFLATSGRVKPSEQKMYVGHVPRLLAWLDEMDIPYKYFNHPGFTMPSPKVVKPDIPGIKFRDYQQEAIREMLKKNIGVVKCPTGSGKTIIMAGIISALVNDTVLIVTYTKDIFNQTIEVMSRLSPEDVGWIGDGKKKINNITIALMQTLGNLLTGSNRDLDFGDWWHLLLVDECHHCRKKDGISHKVLEKIYAPRRFGFTATPPTDDEGILCLEGMIGPQIYDVSYSTLIEDEVLAKPIVKLYESPKYPLAVELRDKKQRVSKRDKSKYSGYKAVYEYGIVKNRSRNAVSYTHLRAHET